VYYSRRLAFGWSEKEEVPRGQGLGGEKLARGPVAYRFVFLQDQVDKEGLKREEGGQVRKR